MKQERTIRYRFLLLSFVAGFCDTVIYVTVGIQRFKQNGKEALLFVAVLLLSLWLGRKIANRVRDKQLLIFAEGIILMVVAFSALLISTFESADQLWLAEVLAIPTMFALGLQKTIPGIKSFANRTYTTFSISLFLIGYISGKITGEMVGLCAVLFPGVCLILSFFQINNDIDS